MTDKMQESGYGAEKGVQSTGENDSLFIDFLKSAGKEIEDMAGKYFDDFVSNAVENVFVRESLESLIKQNEGGKRVRGALIKLGEKIASHGRNHNYLPIAVGYELFQTSVLIHDDIIDRSDTRRGKATIHVDSAEKIKESKGISDEAATHYGISRALCIGDYGFFISYQFLAKCAVDSAVLTKVYQLYSQILSKTCEGEIMDTILPFDRISILDNYDAYEKMVSQIYELKTAWYTLAGPLMLGAVCGGGSEALVDLLKRIAIPLGIAFQIKDDLLGIYSSDEVLGKSVLSDICEGKQTLLFGFAYQKANEEQRALLDRHYGKRDASEQDLEVIRKVFEETGAKQQAEAEIKRLSAYSRELIQNDLIDKEYQAILYGLVSYQTGRQF
ncbi:MAG: polyprenyl synthetase family protein [Lachnospiraceae bacterium]|nr:polyprenyl synthetase family protein [Lachnospiraceae bacterium]